MAGIFPAAGTAAANTSNAASPVNTAPGCDPLYHRVGCVPVFDPAAGNALISEVINAINTLKPYDCTRLDNLATVLSTISDLCKLPTIQEVGVAEPDLDDSLAGCFDGETARVTIGALAQLINAQKSICGLPDANTIDVNDYLAICRNPGDGYRDMKINFALLKQLIMGDGGGTLSGVIVREQLFDSWRAGGNWEVGQPTAGRNAFIFRGYKDRMGITEVSLAAATGSGAYQSLSSWEDSEFRYISGSETTAIDGGRRQAIGVVFKKNGQWYGKSGSEILIPLGADDGTIRFLTPGYQQLTIWSGDLL